MTVTGRAGGASYTGDNRSAAVHRRKGGAARIGRVVAVRDWGAVMAQVRTSGKQAAARKAARERAVERAAEFRRRQEQLEELAAEYFVAADAVDGINEDAEARIQKIRDEQAAAITEAEEQSQAIIERMLDTKVSRDEVAERLGIPVRDVKRSKPKTPATVTADATIATGDDHSDDTGGVHDASPSDAQESYAA